MINIKDLLTVLYEYNESKRLFHVKCYPSGVIPYVVAVAGVCGIPAKELKEIIKLMLESSEDEK